MNPLDLRVPPPVVAAITAVAMRLLAILTPTLTASWTGNLLTAALPALLGIVLGVAGIKAFVRAETTADPRRPYQTSTLVTSGVYRYTRNPMYLGLFLILASWALYLGNLLSGLFLVVFVGYMTRYQIIPEERLLQEKFGDKFKTYRAAVRRWV